MRGPLPGLLVAQAVSTAGTRMSLVALPWFVLVTTGSPTRMGVVAFAEMLPYVLSAVIAAPLVDRLGPQRASVACDLASAAAAALVPLLHQAGLLSFPLLLALVAVLGALRGPGDNAKHVMLPETAHRGRVPLERATSLYDGVQRAAALLGAPLAGVLIGVLGAAQVLLVDAATFLVAALVIAASSRRPGRTDLPAAQPRSKVTDLAATVDPREPYRHQIAAGLRFLRQDRLLLGITVMLLVTNLLDQAYSTVLLPVWARDQGYGAPVVGLVFGASAVGATAGSLAMAAAGPRLPRRATFLLAFLLAGCPRLFTLALGAPLGVVLAVVTLAGLAAGVLNPILSAVELERTPEQLRARVLSATTAIAFAGIPLGGLLAGALVTAVDVHPALALAGAAYLLATLAPLSPTWRGMSRPPAPGAAAQRRP